MIEDREPIPPRRHNPALPRELETIILKAMSKDPNGRYQTAKALADDLRRFLDNKPIHARRPTLLDRASKWARRNLAVVAASFAAMVVVILILSGGLVWIRTAELKAIDAAEVASKEKQKAFDAARIASDERRKALAAARDSRYETLAQILMRILWTTHQRGWSDEAKTAIDEMAGIRMTTGKRPWQCR